MNYPKKWREGVDPFVLNFSNFKLIRVLGYPHAGNDVFYCKGLFNEKVLFCFLKVARQKDNDIKNEIEKLKSLKINNLPKIVEYDNKNYSYIITRKIRGERLSVIVGDNKDKRSMNYMFEFGKALAQIHRLNIKCEAVKHRKFFDIPADSYCQDLGFQYVREWLIKNKPQEYDLCFCHGDFHYANLLWHKGKIVGILDWELAGIGIREYDVAWSLILRPGQKFMNTQEEIEEFLRGYESINNLDEKNVMYYMVQIYLYFYSIGKDDRDYQRFIQNFFKKNCV